MFESGTEIQGLVLLEAMQAGTLVIYTAVMGTAEVMADHRGGLVAREDVEHFAHQARRLLDDPALQATLRAQTIGKAAGWSARATALRLASLS